MACCSSFLLLLLLVASLPPLTTPLPNWCSNRPTTDTHTLPAGSECVLATPVLIDSTSQLDLSTANRTNTPTLARISANNQSSLFVVRGEITLTELVLLFGRAPSDAAGGGCLLLQGLTPGTPLGSVPQQHVGPLATLLRSTVQHCSTSFGAGGAVHVSGLGARLVLDHSTLNNNQALLDGGAVYATLGASVVVRNGTSFNANRAGNNGGAVACVSCRSIELRESAGFLQNTAGQNGGAVFLQNPLAHATASWSSIFNSNTAIEGGGGAVHVEDDLLLLPLPPSRAFPTWNSSNDTFVGNRATKGGAVAAIGTKVFLSNQCNCSANRATNGGGECGVVFCVLVFSCGQTLFCPHHICPTNTTHPFLSVCLSGGCVWWEPLATSNTSTLWQSLHPDFDDTTLPMVFNAATFGKNLATAAYSLRSSTSCSACSENKVVSIQGGKELWPLIQVGLFDLYECCFLSGICGCAQWLWLPYLEFALIFSH